MLAIKSESLVKVYYHSFADQLVSASREATVDRRLINLIPENDRFCNDDESERIIALAYLSGEADPKQKIESFGWMVADYNETVSFISTYKQLGLSVPIISLGSVLKDDLRSHDYYLIISSDGDKVEVGFKQITKVPSGFAHLIVKNEAIYPII